MKFSRKAKLEFSWILLFTICLALVYILTFGDGGFVQLRQYRAELRGLQTENLNLRQRHREYLERISRLKADPSEVESKTWTACSGACHLPWPTDPVLKQRMRHVTKHTK